MNALTIDVEDWYHPLEEQQTRWPSYEDRIVPAVSQLLELLAAARTHATFFVLGIVAETHPGLVGEIQGAGHEIATHGYEHQMVYRQSPDAFAADVRRSLRILSSAGADRVVGYRAPYFSVTRRSLWALPILRELGIQYDSSIFPVLNTRYGMPGSPRLPYLTAAGLLELPPATYPFAGLNLPCAGGAYFRFLPYNLTKRWLHSLNARGEPVVFYLHPWELDTDQPWIPRPSLLRFRHYWALDRTAAKLRRLLCDFRFGSVREALAP